MQLKDMLDLLLDFCIVMLALYFMGHYTPSLDVVVYDGFTLISLHRCLVLAL